MSSNGPGTERNLVTLSKALPIRMVTPALTPPLLSSSRKPSIINVHDFGALSSEATTAINLENAQTSNQDDELSLHPIRLKHSIRSVNTFSSDENNDSTLGETHHEEEEEDLQNILNDLIHHKQFTSFKENKQSYLDYNIFDNEEHLGEDDFFETYINVDKSDDEDRFHLKLKHFFILSSAGKPIYSLNGSDDIIMGYMGIITTIVSTFQENVHEELKSVTIGSKVKIVALNREPLILVAISKIGYELMTSHNIEDEATDNDVDKEDFVLLKQLHSLYDYLLSILSKPVIDKNFHNRMNYDLRKILTPLDFHNLDSTCMQLTYGLPVNEEYNSSSFDFFISELLESSLQNIKISNTTRTKLNTTLQNCKKVKISVDGQVSKSDNLTSYFSLSEGSSQDKLLGEDLLFALLTTSSSKLLSFMKPRNHTLCNEDLKVLISMLSSIDSKVDGRESTEDVWVPLCMPHFNPNGFLYVFMKKFDLSDYVENNGGIKQPLLIILMSTSKNSFFEMQQLSQYIIQKLTSKEAFRQTLHRELALTSKLSILKDIKVPVIKHFIYKVKKSNQFIMSDSVYFNSERSNNTYLQLVYFYTMLHNTKATKLTDSPNKKLTYTRWRNITGFMLSDHQFEFYCLCNDQVNSRDLIVHSLRIIRWCEKNHKRLFIGNGTLF